MKKLALTTLALFTLTAQAKELDKFKEVEKEVGKGGPITFVMDLESCKSDKKLNVVGLVIPNVVMIVDGNRITASNQHFTLNSSAGEGIPAYDYTKYDITEDGGVSVQVTQMRATDYSVISTSSIECQLGKSFKIYR